MSDYLVNVPRTYIDPAKVILIVNSDQALSGQMADYYGAARGLNPAYRITKALGTGEVVGGTDGADQQTFYDNVVVPVANFMDANETHAVVCSAEVPWRALTVDDPTNPPQNICCVATSSYLGCAQFVRDTEGGPIRGVEVDGSPPGGTGPKYDTIEPTGSTDNSGIFWLQPEEETYGPDETHWHRNAIMEYGTAPARGAITAVPSGRLGLPKFNANVPDESALETQRMIDAAIDGRGWRATGEIHFGLHDRVLPWITGYQGELARRAAKAAGISWKHYQNVYSANWPAQTDPVSYDYAQMMLGNLSETAFGMIGSAIMNAGMDAPWVNSYTFEEGSWGFEATSNGFELISNIIERNACAAIGSYREPYANGIPDIYALMVNILVGRPMCMAEHYARIRYPWVTTTYGEPLYAPYKR